VCLQLTTATNNNSSSDNDESSKKEAEKKRNTYVTGENKNYLHFTWMLARDCGHVASDPPSNPAFLCCKQHCYLHNSAPAPHCNAHVLAFHLVALPGALLYAPSTYFHWAQKYLSSC